MAPKNTSTEGDGTLDHDIDLASLEEEARPQKVDGETPAAILAQQQEQQQEHQQQQEQHNHHRRLEDVRRVRDEAESLRQEICQLRTRLEEVEEESKFHAAKANELQELLLNSHSVSGNSGIDTTILNQSTELAQRSCRIEALETRVTRLVTEKALLEIERDDAKKETAKLSSVVRSLQSVTKLSMDKTDDTNRHGENNNDNDDDDESSSDDDESEEEIVLTPETALDLTLGNLKEHIEMLEDGLQASSNLNSDQKKTITTLEKDNHLQEVKIGMLEELFRELNANDRLSYLEQTFEKTVAEQQQQEDENAKEQEDSDPEEASSSSKARENDNLQRLGFVERFRKIRVGNFVTSGSSSPKETKPVIPMEVEAAAKAAELLVGIDGAETVTLQKTGGEEVLTLSSSSSSSHHKKKKNRKTTMKKVKIRFKKAGLEGTYTGPLVDKKPHGVGTIRFSNGDTYLGEMTRGKMSGTGTLYTKSRGTFRGQFENNQFVGEKQHDAEANAAEDAHSLSSGTSSSHHHDDSQTAAAEATTPAEESSTVPPLEDAGGDDDDDEEAPEGDETARANAVAALELDCLSPTTITGSQDIMEGIDDMVVGYTDSIDASFKDTHEDDEILHAAVREENESFLKEFSGSETSSSSLDATDDLSSLCHGEETTAAAPDEI